MKTLILKLWIRLLLERPGAVLLVMMALAGASVLAASRLTLDTNQLNLLDQDLRQVTDVQRVTDMSGGAGYLILALRGQDPTTLKAVADEVVKTLSADPEIREANAKIDTSFFRKNAAMFMATADLEEVRRRVMTKLRDVAKRASPFFFEIKKTEPVKLELDDILAKYQKVGKKDLNDDYYLSQDHQMVLVMIKPRWDSNQLQKTADLVQRLRTKLSQHQAGGVSLVEDYSEAPASDAKVIEFGFTGTYQTNYDDSNDISRSLPPVSGIAFLGVLITLLAFFRRQFMIIFLLVLGMLVGMAFTFGFAWAAIGQLNIITGILGGILMGFGIDFGIHFAYRLHIELTRGLSLSAAVEQTVSNSGPAAFASAAGTGAAFFSLMFSEFRGFSEFGLLAGVGTFLVGASLYLFVPAVLLSLEKLLPGLPRRLLGATGVEGHHTPHRSRELKRPGLILGVAGVVTLAIAAFAPTVTFEYNTRALMIEGQASVRLQDEIRDRFAISSDPVAIYSKDLTQALEVYRLFEPKDPERFSTVDQVLSIYSFLPPADQQQQNAAVLAAWKEELATVDTSKIPEDFQGRWQQLQTFLEGAPFGLSELPPHLTAMVTHLPTAKPENHGYLTYVYAGVDLWDGLMMLKFADEVENLSAPSGQEYHAAGLPILFAKLARIVLHDGRTTVMMTAVMLLLIMMVDLRSARDTAIALLPLGLGMTVMLGLVALAGFRLNFMNIIVFPIILGYGVSHGVYLLHRFREGVGPMEALRSVGTAVACSTLTSLAGWGALFFAAHKGLQSMGVVACFGMAATLVVSFTVMLPVLELLHQRRRAKAQVQAEAPGLGETRA